MWKPSSHWSINWNYVHCENILGPATFTADRTLTLAGTSFHFRYITSLSVFRWWRCALAFTFKCELHLCICSFLDAWCPAFRLAMPCSFFFEKVGKCQRHSLGLGPWRLRKPHDASCTSPDMCICLWWRYIPALALAFARRRCIRYSQDVWHPATLVAIKWTFVAGKGKRVLAVFEGAQVSAPGRNTYLPFYAMGSGWSLP